MINVCPVSVENLIHLLLTHKTIVDFWIWYWIPHSSDFQTFIIFDMLSFRLIKYHLQLLSLSSVLLVLFPTSLLYLCSALFIPIFTTALSSIIESTSSYSLYLFDKYPHIFLFIISLTADKENKKRLLGKMTAGNEDHKCHCTVMQNKWLEQHAVIFYYYLVSMPCHYLWFLPSFSYPSVRSLWFFPVKHWCNLSFPLTNLPSALHSSVPVEGAHVLLPSAAGCNAMCSFITFTHTLYLY